MAGMAASSGGKALGIGGRPLGPPVRLLLLGVRENARNESRALAFQRLLDAPYVHHVIAKADDHLLMLRLPGLIAGIAANSGGNA